MITKIKELLASEKFSALRAEALIINEFYSDSFIDSAVEAICAEFLDLTKFEEFATIYNIEPLKKRIGVLCAGNLPLVGFGDMFYALAMGCDVVLKNSRRDPLMQIFGELEEVTLAESIDGFEECDAILGMGSDATCTMLNDKFERIKTLARGTMHSVAVLSGDETSEELLGLLDDMLLYCGMGCRSVSKLYVPEGYDFSEMVELYKNSQPMMPAIWWDKYRYQRAMAAMRGEEVVDCGCFLLKRNAAEELTIVNYEEYTTLPQFDARTTQHISRRGNFGRAQWPRLEDFSGGVSVIEFLRELK